MEDKGMKAGIMEKLDLKGKLSFSFRVIIVLTIILGLASGIGLMMINKQSDDYREKTVATDMAVKDVRIDINIGLKCVREAVLFGGEYVDSNRATVQKFVDDANAKIDTIKEIGVINASLLEEYRSEIASWHDVAETIMDKAAEGKTNEAMKLIESQCMPAQSKLVTMANEFANITAEMTEDSKNASDAVFVTVIIIIVALIVLALILVQILSKRVTHAIVDPMTEIEKASGELRRGNLHAKINYTANDEMGVLAKNLQEAFEILSGYVDEIAEIMGEFSDGNMDVKVKSEFLGDFQLIGTSVEGFLDRINETLGTLYDVAGQVSGGADQIESASNALAEGATDQTASIEELSATVTGMSEKINATADYMADINERMGTTSATVMDGSEKMKDMKVAMAGIAEKSEDVKNIVNTINEITSQTSLLSLNASIEAARAGESGRGFAVVANEVSKLANESAEAAKNIASLIEETLVAVRNGTEKMEETAEVLDEIVNQSEVIAQKVTEVSAIAKEEAEGMGQITQALEAIEGVVQDNSAASEQTAASSQELSTNAQTMADLLNGFHLASR